MSIIYLEPLIESLAQLQFVDLILTIEAREHIQLPVFSGSTFRGILGHELKRAACSTGEQCEQCRDPENCIYHYLFETRFSAKEDPVRGSLEVPRPFILTPPTRGRVLPARQRAEIGLRLFGAATDYLSYFIYALEQAGQRGIGRENQQFKLLKVSQHHAADLPPTVFYQCREKGPGQFSGEPSVSDVASNFPSLQLSDSCIIKFLTPTRLKHRGELVKEPEFHVLVRALLTRLGILIGAHGVAPLKLDFSQIVKQAETIRYQALDLRWLDWQRYSNRQKRKMKLGGFIGGVEYTGNLQPFGPLLAAGELLNVGKGTTFGLGGYRITTASIRKQAAP
ncbi:MAG: CRISPR system precrRNA processing endoribonuclease RAMP protein Cas6 [Vulcanimicrobiota bacterium]